MHSRPIEFAGSFKAVAEIGAGLTLSRGHFWGAGHGEHDAIIDQDLWDKVQAQLRSNSAARRSLRNQMGKHLLTGLIYDLTGDRLSPTQCKKRGQVYRYYTSSKLIRREEKSIDGWRLPADHFEKEIVTSLVAFFNDQKSVVEKLTERHRDPRSGSSEIKHLLSRSAAFADRLQAATFTEQRDILQEIIHRIDLTTGDVTLSLKLAQILGQMEGGAIDETQHAKEGTIIGRNRSALTMGTHETGVLDTVVQLTIPLKLKRRGVETRLILGGDHQTINPDPKLIEMVARAHIWFQQLSTGVVTSVHQIAEQEKCDASEVSRVMPLAFLAPDIVTAILEGRQPIDLTADRLKRLSSKIPNCWTQQKVVLGFAD